MELLNLISDFVQGKTPGIFRFFKDLHENVLGEAADALCVDVAVLFGIGIAMSVFCGVFAYRFVKVILSLGAAGFGFLVGTQLCTHLPIDPMPEWLGLVCGAVLAVAFFWLAYGRASYVWYVTAALLGYCVTRFYFADDPWVALGGAFVLAMLSIACFRVVYILLTGFGCGVLCVGFVSALLPQIEFLKLEPRNYVFWASAVLVSALFVSAQFLIGRRKRRSKA